MTAPHRSGCPINLTLEVFGDKWSLLIIRDMMFGARRHFRVLRTLSEEGSSSIILADRLGRLVADGFLTKTDDRSHKQKSIYSLTEATIQLLPVFAAIGSWGRAHLPVSEELAIRAELLETGGPQMWARFMDELRSEHLGAPRHATGTTPVREELQAAYQAMVARNRGTPAEPAPR
ncbi:MAG: helix-turn-helix domain-containing protein [Mesorhizobium sp.]|nr:helix-turn-helix domain-containing protein [Mesorhizobium sp.]